jgi:hypothetical protein
MDRFVEKKHGKTNFYDKMFGGLEKVIYICEEK